MGFSYKVATVKIKAALHGLCLLIEADGIADLSKVLSPDTGGSWLISLLFSHN